MTESQGLDNNAGQIMINVPGTVDRVS